MSTVTEDSGPKRTHSSRPLQALSAGLALVAAVLGLRVVQLYQDRGNRAAALDTLTSRIEETSRELTTCQRVLGDHRVHLELAADLAARLSAPGIQMLRPNKLVPDAPQFVFGFDPRDGKAFVFGEPRPTVIGRVYESWVIPKKGAPIPAGTFSAMTSASAMALTHAVKLQDIAAFAVSSEPAPGGPTPTQMLLVAKL